MMNIGDKFAVPESPTTIRTVKSISTVNGYVTDTDGWSFPMEICFPTKPLVEYILNELLVSRSRFFSAENLILDFCSRVWFCYPRPWKFFKQHFDKFL